ncbi:MAG TPA: hypothetical protein VHY79_08590 [Rhizomicrobium sp.]|jgi:hypothetical protein|nr:hypothetical protein [Rhizomicrobium sp.]
MFQKPLAETPAERAGHYRALAMTAEDNAAATDLPALRAAYLRSADRWHKLAALMEMGTGYTPKKIAPRARRTVTRTAKPVHTACAAKQTAPA